MRIERILSSSSERSLLLIKPLDGEICFESKLSCPRRQRNGLGVSPVFSIGSPAQQKTMPLVMRLNISLKTIEKNQLFTMKRYSN